MMRRRRKLWIVLLSVPILLLGADMLYWRIVERNLADGFAAWMAGRRAGGWTAEAGKPVGGGWPLAATLTVPRVAVAGGSQDVPGGVAWSSDRIVLRIALLHPTVLEIDSEGMQHLRLGGGPTIPLTAKRLHLAMALGAAGPEQSAEIAASDLRADLPPIGDPASDLSVGALRVRWDTHPSAPSGAAALGFSLAAEAVDPPPGIARALGPRIASFAVDGAFDGPVPQARALAQRAEAWRDGGGTLEIHHLVLTWGPLDLSAGATLALDDQLQPMGTGNARVVGYAETLDALAAHAVVSRSAATAAKAVLSLLAEAPQDGGPSDVEVPLTLQYRTLSMRQVPLVRLPEMDWP